MEIEVLPPNINESLKNFTVVGKENKIRFGLLAVKNVGENIIDSVAQERKENGKFKSIGDFLKRVHSKDLNKKSLESLIKAGAFDEFEERNKLLSNLEKLLEYSREYQKNKTNGQKGLFETMNFSNNITLEPSLAATNFQKLSWEKELLGLYVTSHPLEDFKQILEKRTLALAKIKDAFGRQRVRVGGIISGIKKIITKKGQPMLFVKLEDLTDRAEVIVFPGIIERNPDALQENKIVFVSGRVDHRDNIPKIIADDIEEIITKEA
ncbi:MAG: OB-fold nucleic acid binding domain-containing protein [bacterium]|nr:OB-fold nucleic acid binding domain-containing protein [bacterium]